VGEGVKNVVQEKKGTQKATKQVSARVISESYTGEGEEEI